MTEQLVIPTSEEPNPPPTSKEEPELEPTPSETDDATDVTDTEKTQESSDIEEAESEADEGEDTDNDSSEYESGSDTDESEYDSDDSDGNDSVEYSDDVPLCYRGWRYDHGRRIDLEGLCEAAVANDRDVLHEQACYFAAGVRSLWGDLCRDQYSLTRWLNEVHDSILAAPLVASHVVIDDPKYDEAMNDVRCALRNMEAVENLLLFPSRNPGMGENRMLFQRFLRLSMTLPVNDGYVKGISVWVQDLEAYYELLHHLQDFMVKLKCTVLNTRIPQDHEAMSVLKDRARSCVECAYRVLGSRAEPRIEIVRSWRACIAKRIQSSPLFFTDFIDSAKESYRHWERTALKPTPEPRRIFSAMVSDEGGGTEAKDEPSSDDRGDGEAPPPDDIEAMSADQLRAMIATMQRNERQATREAQKQEATLKKLDNDIAIREAAIEREAKAAEERLKEQAAIADAKLKEQAETADAKLEAQAKAVEADCDARLAAQAKAAEEQLEAQTKAAEAKLDEQTKAAEVKMADQAKRAASQAHAAAAERKTLTERAAQLQRELAVASTRGGDAESKDDDDEYATLRAISEAEMAKMEVTEVWDIGQRLMSEAFLLKFQGLGAEPVIEPYVKHFVPAVDLSSQKPAAKDLEHVRIDPAITPFFIPAFMLTGSTMHESWVKESHTPSTVFDRWNGMRNASSALSKYTHLPLDVASGDRRPFLIHVVTFCIRSEISPLRSTCWRRILASIPRLEHDYLFEGCESTSFIALVKRVHEQLPTLRMHDLREVHSMVRQPGQSVAAFFYSYQERMSAAGVTEAGEQALQKLFLQLSTNEKTRYQYEFIKASTADEENKVSVFLKGVQALDSLAALQAKPTNATRSRPSSTAVAVAAAIETEVKKCKQCGSEDHFRFRDCPHSQCYNCQQFGHIASNCPQRKQQSHGQGRNKSRTNERPRQSGGNRYTRDKPQRNMNRLKRQFELRAQMVQHARRGQDLPNQLKEQVYRADRQCYNCGNQGYVHTTCWACVKREVGSRGAVAAVATAPRGQPSRRQPVQEQVEEAPFDEDDYDEYFGAALLANAATTRTEGGSSLIKAPLSVSGVEVLALMDSGNEGTFISAELAKRARLQPRPMKSIIAAVTGDDVACSQVVDTELSLPGGTRVYATAVVVDNMICDVVVGAKELEALNMVCDLRSSSLRSLRDVTGGTLPACSTTTSSETGNGVLFVALELLPAEVAVPAARMYALVDTGASRTFIEQSTAEELELDVYPTRVSVSAATGNQLTLVGAAQLSFKLAGVVVTAEVMVAKALSVPMLLGADILQQQHHVLDMNGRRLVRMDQQDPHRVRSVVPLLALDVTTVRDQVVVLAAAQDISEFQSTATAAAALCEAPGRAVRTVIPVTDESTVDGEVLLQVEGVTEPADYVLQPEHDVQAGLCATIVTVDKRGRVVLPSTWGVRHGDVPAECRVATAFALSEMNATVHSLVPHALKDLVEFSLEHLPPEALDAAARGSWHHDCDVICDTEVDVTRLSPSDKKKWDILQEKVASSRFGEDPRMSTRVLRMLFAMPSLSDKAGRANHVKMRIPCKDPNQPAVKSYAKRYSRKEQLILRHHINKELRANLIERCCARWHSPALLVPKAGEPVEITDADTGATFTTMPTRKVQDFRLTNSTLESAYIPPPRIDEILDHIQDSQFITASDLTGAFTTIPIVEEDRHKTAFTTPMGSYQCKTMPFGILTAPAIFSFALSVCLESVESSKAFVDDIITRDSSAQSHIYSLYTLLRVLNLYGLNISLRKLVLCPLNNELVYLGTSIITNGDKVYFAPTEERLTALRDMPCPNTVAKLRSFNGFVQFMARHQPHLSALLRPLSGRLRGKNQPQKYTPTKKEVEAFEFVKTQLMRSPMINTPDYSGRYKWVLCSDASFEGLGSVLLQRLITEDEGTIEMNADWRIVCWYSRALTPAERNYPVVKLELNAILVGLLAFAYYTKYSPIEVFTDQRPLVGALACASRGGTLQDPTMVRWVHRISSEFDVTVYYCAGADNCLADVMSRNPVMDLTFGKYSVEELDIQALELAARESGIKFKCSTIPKMHPRLEAACYERPEGHSRRSRALEAQIDELMEHPTWKNLTPAGLGTNTNSATAQAVTRSAAARSGRRDGGVQERQVQEPENVVAAEDAKETADDDVEVPEEADDHGDTTAAADDVAVEDRVPIPAKLEEMMEPDVYWDELLKDDEGTIYINVWHYLRNNGEHSATSDGSEHRRVEDIAKRFTVINDWLYACPKGIKEELSLQEYRLVIPSRWQYAVFDMVHRDGHPGVQQTKMLLLQHVVFRGLSKKVLTWVQRCTHCAQHKRNGAHKRGKTLSSMRGTPIRTPTRLWDLVSVDLGGPFKSTEGNNNRYLAVFIEHYSRAIQLYAMKDASAAEGARVLMLYSMQYSPPRCLLSDRGTTFTGTRFKKMCSMMSIRQLHGCSLTPSSQGAVEKAVGLSKQLLHMVTVDWTLWDRKLPLVQMLHNSKPTTVSGISPFEALYGCAYRSALARTVEDMPVSVMLHRGDRSFRARKITMQQLRAKVHDLTVQQQLLRNERMKQHPIIEFQVGDAVYVHQETRADQHAHGKAKVSWVPAIITKVALAGGYHVRMQGTRNVVTRNVMHIKRRSRWTEEEIKKAEAGDRHDEHRLWTVDRIEDAERRQEADGSYKTYVLLQWTGFPKSASTWEPVDKIREGGRLLWSAFRRRYPDHQMKYKRKDGRYLSQRQQVVVEATQKESA